jgi:hypothetical protein
MKKFWAAAVLTGAMGVALLAGPSAAPAANCGNYAGSPVKTKGYVDCGKAKAVVKEFIKVNRKTIQGFACKGTDTNVFCKDGSKEISWKK